jgi:LysM repeat protein
MESQNKNLKSIFFNFLLLLAFIFSVMALYISLSFSEKITDQGQDFIKDDFNLEFKKLNHSISELEKKVMDQAESLKQLDSQLVQLKNGQTKATVKATKKESLPAQESIKTTTRVHVIKSGETFSKVSKLYGVSLTALMKANKNLNPNALRIGQEIVIP